MNTGSFPLSNFSNAQLDWGEDNKPRSALYGDIYFSNADALGESSYVFLEKNKLKQRWENIGSNLFIIAECGFGSGLNFLNSCKLWCESATESAQLHYISCENHPLLKQDLIRLHKQWPQLVVYSEKLLQHYPDHTAGIHRLHLEIEARQITLDLLYGDACDTLNSLYQPNGIRVDAWYLDGFSPRLNPQMWSQDLFKIIGLLSNENTTLSTYSVAGNIKRGLTSVGFKISKETGFAQKRHMLSANYGTVHNDTEKKEKSATTLPWFSLPATKPSVGKKVCIIGAGLAGCASAYALAKKGWQVTIIEREQTVASMASGNPQGILHCKISKKKTAFSIFMQQAFLYASRQYQALDNVNPIEWQQCGAIQLAYNQTELEKQKQIIHRSLYAERLLRATNAEENSSIAGLPLSMGGLFFPDSGCLNPQRLCQAYILHPAIKVLLHTEALELKYLNQQWQVLLATQTEKGQQADSYDVCIIANSIDAEKFTLTEHYPLIPSRGQLEVYRTSSLSQNLKTALCTTAYITPATNGRHCIGGSYTANCRANEISSRDSRKNMEQLNQYLPELAADFQTQVNTSARAAIRSSTPDYIPIVGPVENYALNKIHYRALSLNARKKVTRTPQYEPGLFVNLAHGSHGLTSTPLVAEYLASLINNEPLPIPNEVVHCLHPIRFLIRNLKKQQH